MDYEKLFLQAPSIRHIAPCVGQDDFRGGASWRHTTTAKIS